MEAVKIIIVSIEISYILVMGRDLRLENVLLASSHLAGKYVSIKLDQGCHTLIQAKFRVFTFSQCFLIYFWPQNVTFILLPLLTERRKHSSRMRTARFGGHH